MKKQIIVSAGDAITARLVKEAGFDGIWVSGFEASARLGLADNGSITMTEMLHITKPIVEAVDIPVYVDVDTGYGNLQRTVTEFERIGVAGLSVEDNVEGQKQNSLWGGKMPLMDMCKFGDKIHGIRRNKIKIIARTEALIRGYGSDECISRVEHYQRRGADICLPHSREKDLILKWHKPDTPMAIVPTKFPECTNKELFDMGYSMIIWANQTERVKIKAIREALISLRACDCASDIEMNLSATLDDMKGLMPNG
jgi:phosphoenolpyruvate phosphomutase